MCKLIKTILASLTILVLLSGIACAEMTDEFLEMTPKYSQKIVNENPFDGDAVKPYATQEQILETLINAGYLDKDYDWAGQRSLKKKVWYLVNSYINVMQNKNGKSNNSKVPYTITIVTVDGYNTYGNSVKNNLKAVKIDGKDIRKTIYKNEIEDINLSFQQNQERVYNLVEADIKFCWETLTLEDILAGLRTKHGKEILSRKDDFGDMEYIFKNNSNNTITFYDDILLVVATQDLLK